MDNHKSKLIDAHNTGSNAVTKLYTGIRILNDTENVATDVELEVSRQGEQLDVARRTNYDAENKINNARMLVRTLEKNENKQRMLRYAIILLLIVLLCIIAWIIYKKVNKE
jgi:predicted regulator of amino acid metabolism with ACT domain